MEDPFTNKMELFGELTNLLLMYHMLLFTDFVSDPNLRYAIGYSFIGFVIIFIVVHLFFMLKETILQLKQTLRKKCRGGKKETPAQKEARILLEGI